MADPRKETFRYINDDDPWRVLTRHDVEIEALKEWKARYDRREEDSRSFIVQNQRVAGTSWAQTMVIAAVTIGAVIVAHLLH